MTSVVAGAARLPYPGRGLHLQPGGPGWWRGRQRDEYYRGAGAQLLTLRHFPAGTEGQSYWYHLDGRGSVAGLTKQQGQSTHNYRYDAYGQLLPTHGNFTDPHNHYTFSGKEWDVYLDSYEFGYRQYDPWAGVWLTQDPLRGEPSRPHTLHRYQYVFASPISYRDPYGLQVEPPDCEPGEICYTGTTGPYNVQSTPYTSMPAGAYSEECTSQGIPFWMRVLSAPYRYFPGDICLPGNWGCWRGVESGDTYEDWLETWYYPRLPGYLREDLDTLGPYLGPFIDATQPWLGTDSLLGQAWQFLGRPYVGYGIDAALQLHADRDLELSTFQRMWRASVVGVEGLGITALSQIAATKAAELGAEAGTAIHPFAFVVTAPAGYVGGYVGTTYVLSKGSDWFNERYAFPWGEKLEERIVEE